MRKQFLGYRYILGSSELTLAEFPEFTPTICQHIQFTLSGLSCGFLLFFISIQAKLQRDSWLKSFLRDFPLDKIFAQVSDCRIRIKMNLKVFLYQWICMKTRFDQTRPDNTKQTKIYPRIVLIFWGLHVDGNG